MPTRTFLSILFACAAILVGSLITGSSAATVKVSIPLVPDSDSFKVSGSLISLSIETDRWTEWSGKTSRNDFFFNTLDNLRQITGEAPHIRIGGNTQDRADFSHNVKFVQTVFPPPDTIKAYPEATDITIGDSYYAAVRFLPPGTHVTWGVNLGERNLTAAYLQTRSIIKAFGSPQVRNAGIVLDYIAIGNEPDLYKQHDIRPKTYSVNQWVREWRRFATNVSAAAGITPSSRTKLLGASFAFSTHTTRGFSPQAAVKYGLLKGPGKSISTISQHRYSSSFCSGKAGSLRDLMTKSYIRQNLTQFIPDIKAMNARGLNYILGETNSHSCHGAPEVSDTAGAALWALDHALFASQLNITRLFFHNGVGFRYNLVQPVALTRSIRDGSSLVRPVLPRIQPQYYAAIIAAEAIGKSGNVRVDDIDIDDKRVTGYAFYEGTKLARAVFINLNPYELGKGQRSSVRLDLQFVSKGQPKPLVMQVKRLAIRSASETSGLTWGGQTYETRDGRVQGRLTIEIRPVADGLDLSETEAVLVEFLPVYAAKSDAQ